MANATFATLPESHYRDLLAKQVGGKTEVRLPFGRADVLTDTHIYEVEPIGNWRHGAAQALQYAAQVTQRGALAVYGDPGNLAQAFAGLAMLPPPGLDLWWLADSGFVSVESADDAKRYTPPPPPDSDVLVTLTEIRRTLGRLIAQARITGQPVIITDQGEPVAMLIPHLPAQRTGDGED